MKKRICIVTGTRAEYGLLKPLIKLVEEEGSLELQLVATGAHLSSEFGLTYREIEEDGYKIIAKIEMLLSSDTTVGITKSMGIALIGFADYFEANRPDIVIILGDRYEMLMVATAAMIARIPIAHIHGGELTEGLIDEAIRHSITKMSQLHFTTTETYRNRVIQLGEQPQFVFNVGSLGVESVKSITLMNKDKLEDNLKFKFTDKTILITYHPVSLEHASAKEQFGNLLQVIDKHKDISVIFTKANADAEGRIINYMIDEYVDNNRDRCIAFASLGQLRYFSTLKHCRAVVGNSSSGIIEVPSFGIPTVNIGDRQRGRVCAESVINCGTTSDEIDKALIEALEVLNSDKIDNPYEGYDTARTIVNIIQNNLQKGIDLKKQFCDLDV